MSSEAGHSLRAAVALWFVVLLSLKLAAASQLGLYADEAFYWQCAQRLDVAYADVPPLTAFLVRAGTELAGASTLAVRLPFIALGALFPLVIFHLARPLTSRRDAWLAAGASLTVPAVAHLGIVAIPDVPLLFLTALFLLACERATRLGENRWWILAGLVGAVGLTSHYRFVLAPASVALYLLSTARGRERLRRFGPWLALVLLCFGLLPALIYNVQHEFQPIRYHLAGRHGGGGIQPGALWRFFALQAALTTPLLFLALLAAMVRTFRAARRGNDRAALLGCFALTPAGLFLLASPFESSGLATGHWPAAAYVPLLVVLPATLRAFASRPTRPRLRRALTLAAPAFGAAVLLVLGSELALGWLNTSLKRPFVGWTEITGEVERRLPKEGDWLVVADNYKLAAELEFASAGRLRPFALDHPKNRHHGRAPQLAAWSRDEAALRDHVGRNALVVIQTKELPSGSRPGWRAHVASLFERLVPLGEEVRVYAGRRSVRFQLFEGKTLRPR